MAMIEPSYMKEFRKNCIKELKSYGGKLIEIPYTKGVSLAAYISKLNKLQLPQILEGHY